MTSMKPGLLTSFLHWNLKITGNIAIRVLKNQVIFGYEGRAGYKARSAKIKRAIAHYPNFR